MNKWLSRLFHFFKKKEVVIEEGKEQISEINEHICEINEQQDIKKEISDYEKTEKITFASIQLDLFKQIKEGDSIYALMPLNQEELANIEPSHRFRPYLVVKKQEDSLLAYRASGTYPKYLKPYEYHPFSQYTYETVKESYFYLDACDTLPLVNIQGQYRSIHQKTLEEIEKKLRISNHFGKELPHFDFLHPKAEVGDIIQKDNAFYYVYSNDYPRIYTFYVSTSISDYVKGYYAIKGNNVYYYIDFDQRKMFDDRVYDFVDTLSRDDVEKIKQERNNRKRKSKQKSKETIVKKYQCIYRLGQLFYDEDACYVYLYHIQDRMYAFKLKEDKAIAEIVYVPNQFFLQKGDCLEDDKLFKVIDKIIERKKDKHSILQMLKETYFYKSKSSAS